MTTGATSEFAYGWNLMRKASNQRRQLNVRPDWCRVNWPWPKILRAQPIPIQANWKAVWIENFSL